MTNRGPAEAGGVTVTDTLPAALAYVSATSTAGSCSGTRTVTCALGSLAPGASATATLTVRPTARGTVANSARADSSTPDPNAADNTATATVRVRYPRTRVRVTKRATRTTVVAGGVVGYRISVRNRGAAAARSLRVCDRLGAGLAFVTRPGSTLRDGRACWTIRRLARGAERNFRVTAQTLAAGSARRVTNVVSVRGANVAGRTARARVRVAPGRGEAVTG